ncbi:transcriptional regulator [Undibacterium sp. KW1]|uniref:GlxA family transcriptional regulator n=1 Tax=Undibacterium sp. KW1 TaxID=2058624 RepID=UPI001331D751|nr:helix-turn-helix domain-containing protein [Undibacterium sp. KW1]BBB63858.1 transcriptional regulator [Undibacterium sp. KW1]
MDNNTRTIVFITLNGVQSLDLSGPMEVFAVANQHKPSALPAYRLIVASPHGGVITTHAGLEIHGVCALRDLPAEIDTIITTGGSEAAMREAAAENILLPWLQGRSKNTRRIASVCIGALVLAAAGLLNGRRATTHWNSCALLQKLFPEVRLDADAIFTADGPIYTSAGVTAGIDLCLSLLEADGGPALSLAVARELVLYMRRAGGQSQYSHTLQSQVSSQSQSNPRLQQLLSEIRAQPTGDLRTPALAARVHMSERNFSRIFQLETGSTPARFVDAARLEFARNLLITTSWPLARVAEHSGYNSLDTLHRSFMKHLGTTPGFFRDRFGSAV